MTGVVVRSTRDGMIDSFQLVDPTTGEMLDANDPDVQAGALDFIRAEESRLRELKRLLTRQLVDRSVARGERTMVLPGGTKVVREGGPEKHYADPAGLERELLAAGMPADRVAEVVLTTIDKKVSGREAAKVARSNPEYAEIIARHERTIDKPYSIKLGG